VGPGDADGLVEVTLDDGGGGASARDAPPSSSRPRWLVPAAVLAALAVAASGGSASDAPGPDASPTAGSGLLPWPPRGDRADDGALLEVAAEAWSAAAEAGTAPAPAGQPAMLWAGIVGREVVVVLQALDEAGRGLVALTAGPAPGPDEVVLRRVEKLPADPPDVLVLSDVGGVDFGPLLPQAGATLLLPLAAPELAAGDVRVVVRSLGSWQPAAVQPDGLVDAVVHAPGEPWTLLAIERLDPPDGLVEAWQLRAGQLVAVPAPTALRAPAWGRSGPAGTSEYDDADATRRLLEVSRAEVAVLGAVDVPLEVPGAAAQRAVLADVRGPAAGGVLAVRPVAERSAPAGAAPPPNAGAWWPVAASPGPVTGAAVRRGERVLVVVAADPSVALAGVVVGDETEPRALAEPPFAVWVPAAEVGRSVRLVVARLDGGVRGGVTVLVATGPPTGPGVRPAAGPARSADPRGADPGRRGGG
jgi:hypothetical protein